MYYMVSCISSSLSASLGGRPKVPKYATRVTSQENHGFGDVSVAKSIVYVSLAWVEFKFFMCPLVGVPITILSMIFQLISFFWWNGLPGYSKKTKTPNSSALCGKTSAARLELFSGCLFHRQRWGCVNGCILYISIYEYVYNCVCGYYVKYIITYISMTIGMVYYTTHLWWF